MVCDPDVIRLQQCEAMAIQRFESCVPQSDSSAKTDYRTEYAVRLVVAAPSVEIARLRVENEGLRQDVAVLRGEVERLKERLSVSYGIADFWRAEAQRLEPEIATFRAAPEPLHNPWGRGISRAGLPLP